MGDSVFDFEEDLLQEDPKGKYLDEEEEEVVEEKKSKTFGHGTDFEPRETVPQSRVIVANKRGTYGRESSVLSQSVPVSIPARMASSSQRSGIIFSDDDDDEENTQPHELAAKTYQERYIKTGLEWDVPSHVRYTRKGAYSFAGK